MAAPNWIDPNSKAQRIKACYAIVCLSSFKIFGFHFNLPWCFVFLEPCVWNSILHLGSKCLDQFGQLCATKFQKRIKPQQLVNCMEWDHSQSMLRYHKYQSQKEPVTNNSDCWMKTGPFFIPQHEVYIESWCNPTLHKSWSPGATDKNTSMNKSLLFHKPNSDKTT